MPRITTFIIILLCCISTLLQAQKYSTVKIIPSASREQTAELLGSLEVDHYNIAEGGIIAELDEQKLGLLSRSGFQYQVLVDDVYAKIQELNREYFAASEQQKVALEQAGTTVGAMINTPSAFQVHATLGGFYSFAQMNTAMDNLVASYPSLAQKTSLGVSTQGRDIWCIKISDNVATDESGEPEILYIGLQHAREAIGGSSMIFFMQWLCENYATDSRIQTLVNNREIYIIPCMNPDGWE